MAARLPSLGGVVIVVLISLVTIVNAAQPPVNSYISCVNDRLGEAQNTKYNDFVAGTPIRLGVRHAFWSARPPRVPLTVVTGLTASRLDQLAAQCASWKGPLSASVYLVVKGDGKGGVSAEGEKAMADAEAELAEFHKKTESEDGCQLDVSLLYEVVADDVMRLLLPINSMRNYAMVQARTRLVSMIDVDLLVSSTLSRWMEDKANVEYLQRECAAKRVFVLPAFETPKNSDIAAAHRMAAQAVATDKKGLADMRGKKLVHQFALYLFREGHNMTEYDRWFKADSPYEVRWTQDYEPWYIADRLLVPLYDSVFRGYGWNKVTQVNNVNGQGFTFKVHPSAWIVHRQHDRSEADKMYQSGKRAYEDEAKKDPKKGEGNTSLAGMTHRFRNRVLAQLSIGRYAPSLDDGVKGCISALEWWRPQPKGAGLEDEDYD